MHYVSTPVVCLVVVGGLSLGNTSVKAQNVSDHGQLVFTEQFSLPVPFPEPVGLSALSVDSFLVWSDAQLFSVSSHGAVELGTGSSVTVDAATEFRGKVYVFDSVLGTIEVLNPTDRAGSSRVSIEIPEGTHASTAAFTECGLVVLLANDNGIGEALAVHDLAGRVLASKSLAVNGGSYLISGVRGGFALTPHDPMRSIRVFSCDLDKSRTINLDWRQTSEGPKWVASRLLSFGSWFLITVSDFRSDERVLMVLDSDGTTVRATVIHVPLAFVAVTPEGKHAVAVRYTGTSEIVVYSVDRREL